MANLNEFRSDIRAIKEGVWTRVSEAYGDLEILVRGFTDEFHDARGRRQADAAEPYNGDTTKIPNAEQRRINASLMEDFLVIGVRNLLDDNGEQVNLETFHRLLYLPEYARLSRLCFAKANEVTNRSMAQVEAAAKNLLPDSALN